MPSLSVTSMLHALGTVVLLKSDGLLSNHVPLHSSKVMKSVQSTLLLQHENYLHSNGAVKGL